MIGSFDVSKLRGVKLSERYERAFSHFDYTNPQALGEELAAAIGKVEEMGGEDAVRRQRKAQGVKSCCVVL
jgi:hypothetical protein